MKELFVGFKGRYNVSSHLVLSLSKNNYLLTNSFEGVKRDINLLEDSYDILYMFGIDKRLKDKVRIEKAAQRYEIIEFTNIDIVYLCHKLSTNGIDSYISDNPTH